ncbi:MAG: type IX secretion system membrane protein PorP/SprF, partial [Bacteroidota bacterium]
MYTRLLFSLLTLVLLSSNCYAQQLESPTLYKYNLQVFNPAAIDITQIIPITCSVKNSRTILSASGRYRWIGNNFPNSPNSANFRAEVYPDLGKYASIKWGGFGIYDQAGPLTTGRMQATVAGLVPLFEGGAALHILSGGIGAGAIVRHINLSEIHFKDGLNVSSTAMSSVAPSISLGLFYTIINRQGNMY